MRPETRHERRKWSKDAEEFVVEFNKQHKKGKERKRRARWYARHNKKEEGDKSGR